MWWDVHGNPLVLCWSLSPIWVKLWNCPFDCLAVCPRRAQGFQLEALFSKQPFYLLTCICRRSLNLRTWLAPISWRRRNPKRYTVLLRSIILPQANLSLLPSSPSFFLSLLPSSHPQDCSPDSGSTCLYANPEHARRQATVHPQLAGSARLWNHLLFGQGGTLSERGKQKFS